MVSWLIYLTVSSFFNSWYVCSGKLIFLLYFMIGKFHCWNEKISVDGLYFSLDSVSGFMVMMSLGVVGLILMNKIDLGVGWLSKWLLVLVSISFICNNFIMFYVFFELSMVPMVLMVVYYGSQPERLLAVSYMLVYTMVGAIPLMLSMVVLNFEVGTSDFFVLSMVGVDCLCTMVRSGVYSYLLFFFVLAFLMKLPTYGVHLWLPKVHVEAPVEGSIMLAAILLKLGAYGVYRVSNMFLFTESNVLGGLMSGLVFCIILSSLICYSLFDFKVFVAYSSVVHMLVLLVGGCVGLNLSSLGLVTLMVSHGYCSGGLFYCVNLFYISSKTRNIKLNAGVMWLLGFVGFVWGSLSFINCSLPPSLNLVGELCVLNSLFKIHGVLVGAWLIIGVFLVGLFCFFLFVKLVWGHWKIGVSLNYNLKFTNYMSSLMFIVNSFSFVVVMSFLFG